LLKLKWKIPDFERDPKEIGSAFHPDGIRTSKTFHWAGRAGAEIGQKGMFYTD